MPESVVQTVARLVADKLQWAVSPASIQVCETTLASLAHRRGEALSYAKSLLEERGGPDAA